MFDSLQVEAAIKWGSAIYVYGLIGCSKNIYCRITVESCFLLLIFLFLREVDVPEVDSGTLLHLKRISLPGEKQEEMCRPFTAGIKTSILDAMEFLDMLSWT